MLMQQLRVVYVSSGELDRAQYEAIFFASDCATPFHALAWLDVVQSARDDLVLKFAVLCKGGELLACMPYFSLKYFPITMSSMAYGAYGGFIYKNESKAEIKEFLSKHSMVKLLTRIGVLDDDLYAALPYLKPVAENTWIVDVDGDKGRVFQAIDGKTRNQIRKANKSGVVYKQVETRLELEACKKIYGKLVSKHNIKKPYPERIFDGLFDAAKGGGAIRFEIATFQDVVVAYSIFLKSPTQVFYWLNASDNAYSALNATSGLLANMIEHACDDGAVKTFNFGAIPPENEGLLHFKKNWGAKQKTYFSYLSKPYFLLRKIYE